jgi:acyl carrier protein
MDDIRTRLVTCFAAVFPELDPAEVERASPFTVPEWDSLANVTLVSVVEEEFAVQIPLDDLETLGSFELVLDFVRGSIEAGHAR